MPPRKRRTQEGRESLCGGLPAKQTGLGSKPGRSSQTQETQDGNGIQTSIPDRFPRHFSGHVFVQAGQNGSADKFMCWVYLQYRVFPAFFYVHLFSANGPPVSSPGYCWVTQLIKLSFWRTNCNMSQGVESGTAPDIV